MDGEKLIEYICQLLDKEELRCYDHNIVSNLEK